MRIFETLKCKWAEYLIEALVIVVSILGAFTLDNWNENRKQKSEEIKLLHNFRTSIEVDFRMAQTHRKIFDKTDSSITLLLNHMITDQPYHDSLKFYFAHTTDLWSPAINQEVFESVTSSDLNIISNDSLKKEIIAYYSFARRNFEVLIDRYTNIIEDASKNIFSKRFDAMWNASSDGGGSPMIPNDFESLKKDEEYLYFLRTLKNQLYWYMRSPLGRTKKKSEKLLDSIDEELLKLEG